MSTVSGSGSSDTPNPRWLAHPVRASRLTWRWTCPTCQLQGRKGYGEAVAKKLTAVRGAMRHNVGRHVQL